MDTIVEVGSDPEPCSSKGVDIGTEREIFVYSSPVSCSDKPWCKGYAVFQCFNTEMTDVETVLHSRMKKLLHVIGYQSSNDAAILNMIKKQLSKLNAELEKKVAKGSDERRTSVSVAFFNDELSKIYIGHTGLDQSGVVLGVQDDLKWKGEGFLGQPEKKKLRFEIIDEDNHNNQGLLMRFRSLFAGREKHYMGNPTAAVLELDNKVHRCLIMGTENLWMGLNIHQAVNVVFATEKHNRRQTEVGSEEPSTSTASPGLSIIKLDPAAMLVHEAHLRLTDKLALRQPRKAEAKTNVASEENEEQIAAIPAPCVEKPPKPAMVIAMVFTPIPA